MSGTNCIFLSETCYLCQRQCVSVIHSQGLSWTVCVCYRHYVTVTDSVCLLQTFCVRHTESKSVSDSLCLPCTHCDCHAQSLSGTASMCVSQTPFLNVLACSWTFKCEISVQICPSDLSLSASAMTIRWTPVGNLGLLEPYLTSHGSVSGCTLWRSSLPLLT